MNIRQALLQSEVTTRTVQIPALGVSVIVRELFPNEVTEFFARQKESVAKGTFYLVLVAALNEDQTPVFTTADEALLSEAAIDALTFNRRRQVIEAVNQIAETVIELTGLNASEAEKKPAADPLPTTTTG